MKGCYKYLFIFLVSFFFINLKDVNASESYGYDNNIGYYINKDTYFSSFSKHDVKTIVNEALTYYNLNLESEDVQIWYYKDNYILVRPNYAETNNSFSTSFIPINSSSLGIGFTSPYLSTQNSYTNFIKAFNSGSGWSSPLGLMIKSSAGTGITPSYNSQYLHAIDYKVTNNIQYLSMHSLNLSYTYSSGYIQYLYEIDDLPILLYSSLQVYGKYGILPGPIAYTIDVSSNPFLDENGKGNVLMDLYHYYNLDVVSKIDLDFDYIEEHITPNNGSEVLAKIGANLHVNISNCDTSLNKVFYSFDNGNTYNESNTCSFDLTVYKNTDFFVKVTDLDNNTIDSSLLSLSQIIDPSEYMNITYEDAINESDYVEVDGEKILNNGRFKVSFNVPNIENYSYVCDFEFIDNSYNYTKDLTSLFIENNQLYTNISLEHSGNLHCKILDKNKNILFENYSDTLLLIDREKLGPYVIHTKECSENNSSCYFMFSYLNFDSVNYKYYYSLDNGMTLIDNSNDIKNSYLNKWSYTFETNGSIMIIIYDSKNNVVFSEVYFINEIVPDVSNENISFNIENVFRYFSKNISEVFKMITYFFNNLPVSIQNMFYMIFILIVGLMIFKFLM